MLLLSDLGRVDLNHLVCFVALYEARSVTRAGARIGLSQSATSHVLRHLREALGDPLFVRDGRQMVPTARAEALIGPVREGLATLGRALEAPAGFDPATTTRAFRMASVDLFDALVLPRLLARLGAAAPGLTLTVTRLGPATATELERGERDLAVVPVLPGAPPVTGAVREKTLLHDGFVSFCRRGHPAEAALPRSLPAWCAAGHLLVSPAGSGDGVVDRALVATGHRRRVVLRVPDFAAALAVVAETELVLTAPASMRALAGPGLVGFAPPVALPGHRVVLRWSERVHRDPGVAWLRGQLAAVVGGLPAAASLS